MAGAPRGNRNGAKGKVWESAVRHELAKDRERLYRVAEKVIAAAEKGEAWAVTELRNTLDGKPKEHVEVNQTTTLVDESRTQTLRSALRAKPEERTIQ